jgi:hypothetical protein
MSDAGRPLAGSSNDSLVPGYGGSSEGPEVETITLDSFLGEREVERVDFVKMDVEGAEPLVVAGMTETLARSPTCVILAEYNPTAIQCSGLSAEELPRRLREAGFLPRAILPDGRLGDLPELPEGQSINLLCRRAT